MFGAILNKKLNFGDWQLGVGNASVLSILGYFGYRGLIPAAGEELPPLAEFAKQVSGDWYQAITTFDFSVLSAADASLPGLIVTALGGLFASTRKVTTTGRVPDSDYFEEAEYTDIPHQRPGYSDRTAYTLAELSDLAYWQIQSDNASAKAIMQLLDKLRPADTKRYAHLINSMLNPPAPEPSKTREQLVQILEKGNFILLDTISQGSTQGFICLHRGKTPYLVVAFRGSEKAIEDWLVSADAFPADDPQGGKVHNGFYTAFSSVEVQINNAIEKARGQSATDLPVYFTGHSLGGALATIAAKKLGKNSFGACYSFGAPRIGDYDYFSCMKTPVYRVVNAADAVPRVPGGLVTNAAILLVQALSYVTAWSHAIKGQLEKLEGALRQTNVYRHHGDMRYLTDETNAALKKVKLLANPNQLDVVQWFFRHMLNSLGMAVKSHSMRIYRNKLLFIAQSRMQPNHSNNNNQGVNHEPA